MYEKRNTFHSAVKTNLISEQKRPEISKFVCSKAIRFSDEDNFRDTGIQHQ